MCAIFQLIPAPVGKVKCFVGLIIGFLNLIINRIQSFFQLGYFSLNFLLSKIYSSFVISSLLMLANDMNLFLRFICFFLVLMIAWFRDSSVSVLLLIRLRKYHNQKIKIYINFGWAGNMVNWIISYEAHVFG